MADDTDMLTRLWQQKARLVLWGLIGCCVGLLCAVLLLRLSPPQFRVEMMIGPVAHQGAATMGAGAGLAIETGIGANGTMREWREEEMVSDYTRFRQMLTGPIVAESLLHQDLDLVGHLMGLVPDPAPPYWRKPTTFSTKIGDIVRWLVGRPAPAALPGVLELAQHLKNRVEIRPVADTAMHRLVVYDRDPGRAQALLNRLYRRTEAMMRQEASRRLQIQIDYVTQQLGQVSQASQREALGQVLGRFSQARIMLAVDLPFAADLVVPPMPAQERDPPVMVVLAVSMLLGAMGAVGLFIWRRVLG